MYIHRQIFRSANIICVFLSTRCVYIYLPTSSILPSLYMYVTCMYVLAYIYASAYSMRIPQKNRCASIVYIICVRLKKIDACVYMCLLLCTNAPVTGSLAESCLCVLQCITVLQCVAVCCSVLQCFPWYLCVYICACCFSAASKIWCPKVASSLRLSQPLRSNSCHNSRSVFHYVCAHVYVCLQLLSRLKDFWVCVTRLQAPCICLAVCCSVLQCNTVCCSVL